MGVGWMEPQKAHRACKAMESARTKREQRDYILKAVSCQYHELLLEPENLVRSERFAWFGRWCC